MIKNMLSARRTYSSYFIFEKFHHHAAAWAGFFKNRFITPFFCVISRASSH